MESEFAPAKINLFLDIIRKRADGYHDLGTLFQTVDVGDKLFGEADKTGSISLEYNIPQSYPVESDLIYRTAVLLQRTFGVRKGVKFHLEKYLPIGAGLGGGSSDAAAALRLLNRLWNLNLSLGKLEELGSFLGADVPFLVKGGSALAEGIGDKLTEIEGLFLPDGAKLVIAAPKCSVPTKIAYAGCIPSGEERWEAYLKSDYTEIGESLFNKFEETILPQFPLIKEIKDKFISLGAEFALMSGSGSAVFGLFPNATEAENAAEVLGKSTKFTAVANFFQGFH